MVPRSPLALLPLLLASGCAGTARAPERVTLAPARPAARAALSPSDAEAARTARLLDQAIAVRDRDPARASQALLSIVCPGREVLDEERLRACPPARTPEAASAWALVGELAFEGVLALGHPQTLDAEGVGADQLEIAEMAYDRALRVTPSRMPRAVVLYKLAWCHYRLDRFDAAIGTFLELLEALRASGGQEAGGNVDLRSEALEYAAISIAETDWDGDGQDDPVRGFDRPEIKARLAKETPEMPELYARVVSVLVDQAECSDASAALGALARRYPQHPQLPALAQSIAQICP